MQWWKSLALVAALALLAVSASAAEDQRADTRKALQTVVKRLNALDVWFSDAEEQRVRWLNDVLTKDKEVASISEAVESARSALTEVISSLRSLEVERRALQARRNIQAQKISEHLSAAYRLNGQDFVKLLLNQESPDTFDRMMRYHRYFSEARVSTLQEYQTTLDELAQNQAALENRVAEQQTRQTELAARQSALVTERDQRKALIAELDVEVEGKATERNRLAADRARLETLLAELMRRASELDGGQFLARKGSLPWPLRGPIRSTFGRPRADGRLVWHGMVVAAEAGSPVTAVFRGRVIFADWLRGFGLLTIIDHGSGFMTLYGHADSLTKTVGEVVESGEVVARAGRSGGQKASGLYFEVRQKGAARDPLGWLAKR
jgi:septal ring factor EnvC (AmiA/AmiB activator)